MIMIRALLLTAIGTSFALSSCRSGPSQDKLEDESSKPGTVAGVGGGTVSRQSFRIPMNVEYGALSLLGAPASAYSVSLAGCLSGYTATVSEVNLDGVEVYKDDWNCLAKLTSFTVGGTTYTNANPGAVDFTTWLAGNTATFASAGGDTIRVVVVAQLASPITGTEAIVYQFSELLDGDGDKIFSEAEVSDAHLITVEGQEAPLFNIVASTFLGMDDVSGAPEFTFKMECVDDPAAATPVSVAMTDGAGSNTVCGTNELSTVTYKLVKDTYGSVLTITQAEAIFGTAGTSITVPGDQYADSATQEGFNTATLDGPGGLGTAGNENMILILKSGASYTYFNVDVTTISQ